MHSTESTMNIFKSTKDFEQWVAKRLPIVREDVTLKHMLMAQAPFPFFRATFYRWLQHWHEACPDVAKAPAVLGVGDLHVENFGTWRDEEGRLTWLNWPACRRRAFPFLLLPLIRSKSGPNGAFRAVPAVR